MKPQEAKANLEEDDNGGEMLAKLKEHQKKKEATQNMKDEVKVENQEEPKKEEPKEEPKNEEPKKEEPKKEDPKKEEPKQESQKKIVETAPESAKKINPTDVQNKTDPTVSTNVTQPQANPQPEKPVPKYNKYGKRIDNIPQTKKKFITAKNDDNPQEVTTELVFQIK